MRSAIEAVVLPLLALAGALLLFGVWVAVGGVSPLEAWALLFKGAFGDTFSWQNTLQRAAPLMLTALAVALPARAGLVVIGGEGALVLGALGCAALPYVLPSLGGAAGSAPPPCSMNEANGASAMCICANARMRPSGMRTRSLPPKKYDVSPSSITPWLPKPGSSAPCGVNRATNA